MHIMLDLLVSDSFVCLETVIGLATELDVVTGYSEIVPDTVVFDDFERCRLLIVQWHSAWGLIIFVNYIAWCILCILCVTLLYF